MRTTGLVFLAALALAGCGGGGGNPGTCTGSPEVCGGVDGSPPPSSGTDTVVGRYQGTTDTGRTAYTLVLDNGQLWILYGQVGSASLLGGAEQGAYSAADGDIASADLADFNAATGGVVRGSLAGSYVSEESIAASVTFGGDTATIAGSYDTDSGTAPDLADAAGTYDGTLAVTDGTDIAAIAVSASGAVTGTSRGGCSITGTLLPEASANAFTLTASLAGGVCGNERLSYSGVAILQGTRLLGAGFTAARTEGFTFSGGR